MVQVNLCICILFPWHLMVYCEFLVWIVNSCNHTYWFIISIWVYHSQCPILWSIPSLCINHASVSMPSVSLWLSRLLQSQMANMGLCSLLRRCNWSHPSYTALSVQAFILVASRVSSSSPSQILEMLVIRPHIIMKRQRIIRGGSVCACVCVRAQTCQQIVSGCRYHNLRYLKVRSLCSSLVNQITPSPSHSAGCIAPPPPQVPPLRDPSSERPPL